MSEQVLTKKQKEGLDRIQDLPYLLRYLRTSESVLNVKDGFAIIMATEGELLKIKGVGPKTVESIKIRLSKYDLTMGMEKWKIDYFIRYFKGSFERNSDLIHRTFPPPRHMYTYHLLRRINRLRIDKANLEMQLNIKKDGRKVGST